MCNALRSQRMGKSEGCSTSLFKRFLQSLLYNSNQGIAPGFASHLLFQTSLSSSFPGFIPCQLQFLVTSNRNCRRKFTRTVGPQRTKEANDKAWKKTGLMRTIAVQATLMVQEEPVYRRLSQLYPLHI